MSLAEVVNTAKWSSGYHGDGPAAATPNYGFLFNGQQQPEQKQQTALKLLQLKALVAKYQADAAIEQRKQVLWNNVGTPAVGDKSTAGDVTNIVDSEKVGGRDAGVVNDGEVAGNADTTTTASIPANTQSDSTLVNMIKGLQPNISTNGNMILTKTKPPKTVAKNYDQARTFDYAKRLADQSIIQSGKRKKDIAPEDYRTLVNDNIPQAEKYLYGRVLSQPDQVDPNAKPANDTGIKTAVQTALEMAKSPAPGEQPNAPQVGKYNEGQTAINPKTGKRLKYTGGQWVPTN